MLYGHVLNVNIEESHYHVCWSGVGRSCGCHNNQVVCFIEHEIICQFFFLIFDVIIFIV